ncbi:site-specific integrase, partial [Vibrio breoganii]
EHRTHDLKMHESTRQIMRLCFYLGGQRPTEVCNLKWSDIDEEEMIVTIPDYVSKTKKELLIALTKSSYSLLTKHRETSNSPYIFPKLTNPEEATPVNTISQAVGRYRSRAGISPFIARDFRRTFKTLTGQLNISKELRDRVQGHTPNDASNKHYDRYDYMVQKREVMEKWCTYLENGIAKHEISPDFNYSG